MPYKRTQTHIHVILVYLGLLSPNFARNQSKLSPKYTFPHRFQYLFILYMVLILVVALGFNRGSMEGTADHTAATKTLMEA